MLCFEEKRAEKKGVPLPLGKKKNFGCGPTEI
jgi:hypothetical protein